MSFLSRWLGREPQEPIEARGDPVRIAEVRAVIASIEPLVRADGGRIDLLAVEEGRVHVRLSGACTHCHASDMTLRGALEPRLRAELPWFQGLHAD